MELRDFFRILRRSWILILASTLIGITTGALASVLSAPTYTAETQLFVAIQSSGSVQELQQGNNFTQARVQSYVKTVDSPAVLQPAIDALGLRVTPQELASRVTASTELNTVLINIEVRDGSPVQAAAIAQAVANSMIQAIENLERPKSGGASPVNLSVITPATAPPAPSSPNTRTNILVAAIAGLAMGAGAAVLRGKLDSRVRGEVDLRRVTSAPLLGGISHDSDARRRPLLTQAPHQSPRAESFRQLRTNLQFANVARRAKTVLITSSLPGEGKSTTATNLAIALAQAGQSVCLVDADLRRPMVGEYLGLDRSAGLTTALIGTADVEDLLHPWGEDNLYVLTSGRIPPNPSELLGSRNMEHLLGRLEATFDTIIIDAPPLLPVTDAAVLSQHVGGVVLVVGAQTARARELERAIEALELVGAALLGVVLNHLPARGPDAYSYGYYASSATDRSKDDQSSPRINIQERSSVRIDAEDFENLLQNDVRRSSTFPRSADGLRNDV